MLSVYIHCSYKWLSRRWAWRAPPQSRAGLELFSFSSTPSFILLSSILSLRLPLRPFLSSFSSRHFFYTGQSFVCGLVSVLSTRYWWIFSLVFFLPVFFVGSRDATTYLVLFFAALTTLFKISPS